MKYIIKNGGPVFDGLEAQPSKKQEKKGSRTTGIWLNVRVTPNGKLHRIWFGNTEVKEEKEDANTTGTS